MSKRIDILDGQRALSQTYGLVYTCNLGWLDLGHMNPESTRPHTGASALWKEINTGGPGAMAKPVSKETALAIWDRNGSVGSNKNRGFQPMFSPDTSVINDKACINECAGALPRIPEFLAHIKPAKKGTLFINNALGGV